MSARRGWRERIQAGVYRSHRVVCPSSKDRKPGRRCRCPWQVVVPGRAPGTTRLVTVEGSLRDAVAKRRALQAAGRPTPARTAEREIVTLDDLAGAYLRAKEPLLAPDTIRNRGDDYRLRIAPDIGHLDLHDVDRRRVEAWLSDLTRRASSRRMVVQTVATLRVILATGLEWGLVDVNSAAGLTVPAPATHEPQQVERVLDAEQMARLFAAAGGVKLHAKQKRTHRTETMLRAAGEAGLRRGEIAGLKWPDVDLAGRRLHVRRAIVQVRAAQGEPMRKIERPPKGRRARRVAITTTLAEQLGEWFEESVVSGGADAVGYVWPGRDGGPMHDASMAHAVRRACLRAGLFANPDRGSDETAQPLVSPHGLRHSAASIMLSDGVPLIVVSRQLGHANPNITATIYAHLLGDAELDRAAAAFRPPRRKRTSALP